MLHLDAATAPAPIARRMLALPLFLAIGLGCSPAAVAGEDKVDVAELSPQAEAAISKGLAWLAKRQKPDGSWEREHTVACTGFALMAFMLQGHFPERSTKYGDVLEKGLQFLLAENKRGSGYMGRSMYEHAIATLALSEVWGMSLKEEIRDALKRSVNVILKSQNNQGGWRYNPRPESADISVTVLQIVALVSAHEAGIVVPEKTIQKALLYVKGLQVPGEGGFGYDSPRDPAFARSAAGVMAMIMCGDRQSRAVERGLAYLKRQPFSKFWNVDRYFYGHYYAIQSMYQMGESRYQQWYPHIRDAILQRQTAEGCWHGDMPVAATTSVAILILGVPYRFLPIYQR